MAINNNRYLSPAEAAVLMRVSPITVRDWVNKGDLKAFTTPGGHRRFQIADIEEFAKAKGITLEYPEDQVTKILIVDDDVQVAGYLYELLSTCGVEMEIQTAHDGFEAGAKVMNLKPDIVLLDLMMPGINGFQVCQIIKKDLATRDIKIIALTGYYTDDNVKNILDAGAYACLKKPIDSHELFKQIGISETPASITKIISNSEI